MAAVRDNAIRPSPEAMADARWWAETDATPRNQFVMRAVRENIAALQTQQYFAARRARADLAAFDCVLAQSDTAAPRRTPAG